MALPGNAAMMGLYAKLFGQPFATDWKAGLTAPFVEETAKGAIFLLCLGLAPIVIRTVYDGLLVGAYVGLGFQVLEDMLYGQNAAARAFGAGQVENVLDTFVLRAVTGVASHALYTALFAAGLIYLIGTVAQPRRVGRGLALMVSAMLIHGLWDSAAALAGPWVYVLLIVLTIGAIAALIVAFRAAGGREHSIARAILAPEVANGTLTEAELDAVAGTRKARRTVAAHPEAGMSKRAERRVFTAARDLAHDLALSSGDDSDQVRHSRGEIARLREPPALIPTPPAGLSPGPARPDAAVKSRTAGAHAWPTTGSAAEPHPATRMRPDRRSELESHIRPPRRRQTRPDDTGESRTEGGAAWPKAGCHRRVTDGQPVLPGLLRRRPASNDYWPDPIADPTTNDLTAAARAEPADRAVRVLGCVEGRGRAWRERRSLRRRGWLPRDHPRTLTARLNHRSPAEPTQHQDRAPRRSAPGHRPVVVRIQPVAEDRLADPHRRRPVRDGQLVVARHPHGQLRPPPRKRVGVLQPGPQIAHPAEAGADQIGVVGEHREGHQPPHPQGVEPRQLPGERRHRLRRQSELGVLPRRVHLHEDVERAIQVVQPTIQRFGQPERIEGVELGGHRSDLLGLVRLQVPDHRPVQVRDVGEHLRLGDGLLHLVLAEQPDPGVVRLPDQSRRLGLADRQQSHLGRVPIGRRTGLVDTTTHLDEVRSDLHRHSVDACLAPDGHVRAARLGPSDHAGRTGVGTIHLG